MLLLSRSPATKPPSQRSSRSMSASADATAGGATSNGRRAAAQLPPRPRILALDLDATVWVPELYQLWGGAPFRRCPKTGRVQDRNGERLELMGHAPRVFEILAAARGRGGAAAESDDEEDGEDHLLDEEALLLSDRGWEATELAYVSRTEHGDWAADALRCFTFPLAGAGGADDHRRHDHDAKKTPASPRARRRAERRAQHAVPHLHALADHHEIYPGSKVAHFKRLRERTGADYGDMLFFDNESWNVKEVERLGVVSVYCPRGLTRDAWEKGLRMFAERRRGLAESGGGSKRR